MQQIKLRDFQRNFCKLIKAQVSYAIIDQQGAVIGHWIPGCLNFVRQASLTAKSEINISKLSDDMGNDVGHAEGSELKCFKCGGRLTPVSYQGESFNEIGEWAEMKFCAFCYFRFKPAKFKKVDIY